MEKEIALAGEIQESLWRRQEEGLDLAVGL